MGRSIIITIATPVSGHVATLMETVIFNNYIKMLSESPGTKFPTHQP